MGNKLENFKLTQQLQVPDDKKQQRSMENH
jgi:hypothetical protein